LPDILSGKSYLCRSRRPPFGTYLPQYLCVGHRNADIPQAVKGVQESQGALVDIFERIESFFRRLEIYIQVSATTEMKDVIIQIMAEVLCVIGVATKEIKESRTSE